MVHKTEEMGKTNLELPVFMGDIIKDLRKQLEKQSIGKCLEAYGTQSSDPIRPGGTTSSLTMCMSEEA